MLYLPNRILNLFLGWLFFSMSFCLYGEKVANTTDYSLKDGYSDENKTYQEVIHTENVSAGVTEGDVISLERQKKEDRLKEREELKRTHFLARDDLWKKRYRTTSSTEMPITTTITTTTTTTTSRVHRSRKAGPKVERIIQRFLVTTGRSTTGSDSIEEPETFSTVAISHISSQYEATHHITTNHIQPEETIKSKVPFGAISSENFDTLILNSNSMWVVQFYSTSPTCIGCMINLKSLLVSTNFMLLKDVKLVGIDVAKNPSLVSRFNLFKLPVTKVFYPFGVQIPMVEDLDDVRSPPDDATKNRKSIYSQRITKKVLTFSSYVNNSIAGNTDIPLIRTPGSEELLNGNDSHIKMKEIDTSTELMRSDADRTSFSDALQVLLLYAILRRIWKLIFIHFVNNYINTKQAHDL